MQKQSSSAYQKAKLFDLLSRRISMWIKDAKLSMKETSKSTHLLLSTENCDFVQLQKVTFPTVGSMCALERVVPAADFGAFNPKKRVR